MVNIRPNDASTVVCDVCEQVVMPAHAKFIRVYENSRIHAKNKVIHTVDVCPACYAKLCGIFRLER